MTTYRERHLAGHHTDKANAPDEPAAELNVAELKEALAALDQPVSGNKAELQARLDKAQKTA